MGFAYAIGAAITWGLTYAIDQKILSGLSPIAFLFVESVITAILMLPLLFFNSDIAKNIHSIGKASVALILISIVLAIGANYFILSSIRLLGSSNASIIEIAYPFFVAFFSFLIFRTVPNIAFYLGGLLIFAGSAIIIYFH